MVTVPIPDNTVITSGIESPRQAMRERLPAVIQPFLTIATGKPYQGEQPTWQFTSKAHLASASLTVITGVALNTVILQSSGDPFLLLGGWLLTVSGARKLQAQIVHQCAHLQCTGREKFDIELGKTLSILLMIKNFQEYQQEHSKDHHAIKTLMTIEDPTFQFLQTLGLLDKLETKKQLWFKLLTKLLSPRFHWQSLKQRLSSNFLSSDLTYSLKSWGLIATVIGAVTLTHTWTTFFWVWLFPMTILYQISSTLRLCAEHLFPENLTNLRDKKNYARLTTGIFLGEAPPSTTGFTPNSLYQWTIWWLKMIFFHFLFCRVFVLVGDTPVHDYHHRFPVSSDWINAIFARQQDLDNGCPGWQEDYQEVWGLFSAIDLTFDSLIRFKNSNSPENQPNF